MGIAADQVMDIEGVRSGPGSFLSAIWDWKGVAQLKRPLAQAA